MRSRRAPAAAVVNVVCGETDGSPPDGGDRKRSAAATIAVKDDVRSRGLTTHPGTVVEFPVARSLLSLRLRHRKPKQSPPFVDVAQQLGSILRGSTDVALAIVAAVFETTGNVAASLVGNAIKTTFLRGVGVT